MATKSRVYEVTLKDGHGDFVILVPAQSAADIRNNLRLSPHVQLISIGNWQWIVFYARPNNDDTDVEFFSESGLIINRSDLGFLHLKQQFPNQVASVTEYINRHN